MAKLRKLQILNLSQKTPFQSLCTLISYKTTYFWLFFHLSVKDFKKMLWKWSKRGESVGRPLFIQHPANVRFVLDIAVRLYSVLTFWNSLCLSTLLSFNRSKLIFWVLIFWCSALLISPNAKMVQDYFWV